MSNCNDYPTPSMANTFRLDAITENERVTLEQDRTNPASDGKTKKTMWGIENDATLQLDEIEQLAETQRDQFDATFQAQFTYAHIGNISDFVGDTLTDAEKLNSYQYPDDSGDWYGPIQSQTFPIAIPADPTVSGSGWNLVNGASEQWVADNFSNTNLLSNHNFLTQTPDGSQPPPSSTPTSYPPGHQIFSGVFANETVGITNLTYIDGRVSFSGGDLYFAVPNTGAIAQLDSSQLVASVADFDGKPRTRGVSFGLVGDEYRVTVGIDALEDDESNETLLGSVKFEQGSVATGHEVEKKELSPTVSDVYGMNGNGEFNNTNLMIKAIKERLFIDFDSGTYLFDTTPEAGDFLLYLGTQGPLGNPTSRNGMHIKGRGLSTVIKLADNVGPATLLFGAGVGDEIEDMVFEDLVFDLNGQNNLQNDYSDPLRYNSAFYFFCKCSRIKFKNVYIKNGSGHQLIRVGGDTAATFGDDIEFDVTIDTCGRAISGNFLQDISAVYCQASNVRGTIRGVNPEHTFDLSRGQTLAELHVNSLENINIYAEQFQLPWLLVAALKDVELVHINSCILKECNYIGSLDPAGTFAFKDIRIDGLVYSSTKVTSNLFVFGAPGEQPKSRELITMNAPVINGFGSSAQDTHVFRIEDSYLRDFTINNPRVSGLNGSLFFVAGEVKNNNTATISIKGGVLDSLGSTGGIFPTSPSMIDFAHSSGVVGFLDITDITFLNTALKNYGTSGPVYLNGDFNRVGVRDLTNNMESHNLPLLNLGPNYTSSNETHEVRESKYSSPQFNLPGNTTLNLIGLRDIGTDDYAALTIRLVGTTGSSNAISATYAANWDNGGGTVSVLNESGVYAPDIAIQWSSQFLQVVSTTATPINFRLFVEGVSTNNFTRSV